MRGLSLLLVTLALTLVSVGAQQSQPPLTFKVDINYVEIDATVTDSQGKPVPELRREDFEVLEERRPQSLTVFSRVDLPVEHPDPPLFRSTEVEPDVRSNRREFDGRVFVIVLDDFHTGFTRTARLRAAVTQFIQYLGANDVAAIVTTSGARGAQEFTSSRALLLRAVNQFSGRKLPSGAIEKMRPTAPGRPAQDPNEFERAHYARNMLASLKSTAEYLAGIRGRRKALVLFSEGIDYDLTDQITNRFASDVMSELRTAVAAATRGNVSFYTVDPRGLTGFEDAIDMPAPPADNPGAFRSVFDETRRAQDSLRILAEETGGIAAVNRNDYREAFERIIRDNSTYYVLGYYSDNTRRDGRFRAVDVKVKRPGLTVRARKGYTAPRGNAPALPNTAVAGTSTELREAMASPVPVSGLTLSASAVPFRAAAGGSVLLIVEIDGSKLRFAETDGKVSTEIEVVAVPLDASGKPRPGGRDALTINPRPQTRDAIAKHGLRVTRRFDLPAGRYSIRLGAREAVGGLTGSVILDVEVPDFAKRPLAMSGIVLTMPAATAAPTPKTDDQLKDVLPAPPTVQREFNPSDELTIFAEVYDSIRAPHKVEIKTTVTAYDGKVVYSHTDQRGSDEIKQRGDGFGHVRAIPLRGFAAGRYVLRVDARGSSGDGDAAFRELEFTIR
jgi:VWFA-related protein